MRDCDVETRSSAPGFKRSRTMQQALRPSPRMAARAPSVATCSWGGGPVVLPRSPPSSSGTQGAASSIISNPGVLGATRGAHRALAPPLQAAKKLQVATVAPQAAPSSGEAIPQAVSVAIMASSVYAGLLILAVRADPARNRGEGATWRGPRASPHHPWLLVNACLSCVRADGVCAACGGRAADGAVALGVCAAGPDVPGAAGALVDARHARHHHARQPSGGPVRCGRKGSAQLESALSGPSAACTACLPTAWCKVAATLAHGAHAQEASSRSSSPAWKASLRSSASPPRPPRGCCTSWPSTWCSHAASTWTVRRRSRASGLARCFPRCHGQMRAQSAFITCPALPLLRRPHARRPDNAQRPGGQRGRAAGPAAALAHTGEPAALFCCWTGGGLPWSCHAASRHTHACARVTPLCALRTQWLISAVPALNPEAREREMKSPDGGRIIILPYDRAS